MSESATYVYTNPLGLVLEQLIDASPEDNKGAVEVQLVLRSQPIAWAGATRRGPVPGTFVTTSLAQGKDENGRASLKMAEIFFAGDDLLRVEVLRDHQENRITPVGPGDERRIIGGLKR